MTAMGFEPTINMTGVSRKVYIDKLDEIVDKYSNTYRRALKMKAVDVKSGSYIV